MVNQIMSMLEETCFGRYYFQVAMVFRFTLLISSLWTNSESWYHITSAAIDDLEKVDEGLLRRILECPAATPKEMLYLELGVSPIRNIIKSRRINFLQNILKEEKDSLMYTFLQAQLEDPTCFDWGETIKKDLEEYKVDLSLQDIEKMSEDSFKRLIQKKEKLLTLNYLNELKAGHTKVLHIPHTVLGMADYLKPNDISNMEAKFIFSARCRMIDVRSNFPGQHPDTRCPLCDDDSDTQEHLLVCTELETYGVMVEHIPKYVDLFGENLQLKVNMSRILKSKYTRRKQLTRTNPE